MSCKQTVVILSAILASLLATAVSARAEQNLFRNTLTGPNKCLDIINDGENNKLTMATCGNSAGQSWSIVANKTSPKNYRLQTPFAGANKCLEVINDGNNERLTMAKCSDATGQLWNITANKMNPGYSGYYRLRSELTGDDKCLEIFNDDKNERLTMATCGKIARQSWKITQTP
jgi:uncharacterized membrane protein